MRNLKMYAKECMTELDNIGIEYGNIIEFRINTRAKKAMGFVQSCSKWLLD